MSKGPTESKSLAAEEMATKSYESHGIPRQLIDGVITKNPHMRVKLGQNHGDFTLADKLNPRNIITFTPDVLAHISSPDANKYNIDISNFDNSASVSKPFIIKDTNIPESVFIAQGGKNFIASIRTKGRGVINTDRYYAENGRIRFPVRFTDKNGNDFRLDTVMKPEMDHAVYVRGPHEKHTREEKERPVSGGGGKLFPTASMGKKFTGAMLMKTFENLENALDKDVEAGKAKQALLVKHNATTLMDVPIKDTVELLKVNKLVGNEGLTDKTMDLLNGIPLSGDVASPERMAAEQHRDSICPRMLLNHFARIPDSFGWQNTKENTLLGVWGRQPDAIIDGASLASNYRPVKPFLPEPEYSNGNTAFAGLLIESLTGQAIQQNLAKIGAGDAVIHTSRATLDGMTYAPMRSRDELDATGKPNDPGYTAGGYLASPETVARFSQSYLSGSLFERPEYKKYLQDSYAAAMKHGPVKNAGIYENSLVFQPISDGDPLREQGYTHFAGHNGGTPNIATSSITAVKIDESGKIAKDGVGPTYVSMSTFDTRGHEKYLVEQKQEQVLAQRRQNLDALDLATMAPISPELIAEARKIGAEISTKLSLDFEIKGRSEQIFVEKTASRTTGGSREV